MNKEDIYVFYDDGNIVIHEYFDFNNPFCIQSDEFIRNLATDIRLRYLEMKNFEISDNQQIYELLAVFSSLESLIEKLKYNVDNQVHMKLKDRSIIIQHILTAKSNIESAEPCFEYFLQKTEYIKLKNISGNIANIKKYIDLLDKTQYSALNLKDFISNIDQLSSEIVSTIKALNQSINLNNTFMVSQYKILKVFRTLAFYAYEFYKTNSKDINLMKLQSFLIDQNQEPVALFSNYNTDSSGITDIFSNCLDQYSILIKNEFPKYFDDEIDLFANSINMIIKANLPIEKLISELDQLISKFNLINSPFEMTDKIYFNSNEVNPNTIQISNSEKFLKLLLNISKYHLNFDFDKICHIIYSIFSYYDPDINQNLMNDIFSQIISFLPCNDTFEKEIKKCLEKGQYYIFDYLFQMIIKYLLNQVLFSQYEDLLIFDDDYEEDDNESRYLLFFDLFNYSNYTAYFKFAMDRKFNFSIEKYYNQYLPKEVIERECNIFKENFSEFIVHLTEDLQDNKIFLPYYSFQTLDYALYFENQNMKFTLVDIIVIISEIAYAIQKLHQQNEYHGNLSLASFYISSNKNAVLGEIAYDKKYEGDQTRMPEKFFYRAPEFLSYKDNPDDVKSKQLSDVYSFGLIMYEIFTKYSPRNLMRRKPRYETYNMIKEGLVNRLFPESTNGEANNDLKNEIFDCVACDIRGDSLIGMKEIIKKCLSVEPSERFQSFDEIITSIKNLAIYEKNKDEIEFRIRYGIETSENKCNLSDIVEAYYRGDINCIKLIDKIFKNINDMIYTDYLIPFVKKEDMIKSIYDCFQISSIHDL